MRYFNAIILILLLMAVPVLAKKITNGEELVGAMHKKYAGKWYKTLTFVQKTTQYRPDGTTQVTTWYEAMKVPGKLRIDIAPLENGNGILFLDDMQHNFNGGKLARSQKRIHPLLVLGFDVYGQSPATTVSQLKELNIDLSVLREDTWQNRAVYVVGAKQGDMNSPQFWIDKKNLYFVRLLEPVGRDKKQIQEIQFNKYHRVKGGGWISPEVTFFVDGKQVLLEEYSDIQTDIKLDEALFDTGKWAEVDKTYFQKKIER